jgi:hypothetical protein
VRAVALVLVALTAGCGGAATPDVPAGAAKTLVLQPRDLSRGFVSIGSGEENPLAAIDDREGPPKGRTASWYADYRRPGGVAAPGPLIVQSRVEVFDGRGSAEVAYSSAYHRISATRTVARLGDESGAAGQTSPGAQIYRIVWRRANVVAALVVTGLEHRLTLAQSARLAHAQDARIAARVR